MAHSLSKNKRTVTFYYTNENYVAIHESDAATGNVFKCHDKNASSARDFYRHLRNCGYTAVNA